MSKDAAAAPKHHGSEGWIGPAAGSPDCQTSLSERLEAPTCLFELLHESCFSHALRSGFELFNFFCKMFFFFLLTPGISRISSGKIVAIVNPENKPAKVN